MSDKPVYSAAAAMDPAASIATANKMLSNTYWLLGLTLAFSALTATLAVVMDMPPVMALPLIIVGFVLLFVVHKMADSAKGLPAIFAFTGVWGASQSDPCCRCTSPSKTDQPSYFKRWPARH